MNTPTPSMDPEVKAEWLTALRSGEYAQTQGYLHREEGGYCCLGVLCEITRPRTGLDWGEKLAYGVLNMDGCIMSLPSQVLEVSGLKNADIGGDTVLSELITMNDAGDNFLKIADVIEAKL